jgi:hypothetical protein
MKKKVSEILNVHYVEGNISCEPSKEEIKKAVDEKNLETRGYALESRLQGYLEAGCIYAAKETPTPGCREAAR